MLRRLVPLLFALSLATPAAAATSLSPQLPIREHHLKNGLTVLLLEDHKAPVASVQVWYRVGARNEQINHTGLAHYMEHMSFQGSTHYPTGAYKRIVEENGGDVNAETWKDYTDYHVTMSSDKLPLMIQLEADRMNGLTIPEAKVKSEMAVVREERRWRSENDPFGVLYEAMDANGYEAYPYRWPVVGWMSDLEAMTRQDLVNFYRTFYHPRNATVVIVGDIQPAKALAMVEQTFGKLPEGPPEPPVITQEPVQQGERRVEVRKNLNVPGVIAAWHVPALGHADVYALDVLDKLLTNGRSSRLYLDLVYKKKIAQEIGSENTHAIGPSLFFIYGNPLPGHSTAELEQAVYGQLDAIASGSVTPQELTKAVNQTLSEFIYGQEKSSGLGHDLGEAQTLLNYRFLTTYVDRISKVTPADVQRVVRTYFTRDNRTVVTLVPNAQAAPEGAK